MEILCKTTDLCVDFKIKRKVFGKADTLSAVKDANIELVKGETFGLVGESGCGKTTLANTILGFNKPTSGSVTFGDMTVTAESNKNEWQNIRKHMQIVFQDPFSSLNPRFEVWQIIGEPLLINGETDLNKVKARAEELLLKVGLGKDDLNRNIFEFSGGQRQRIAIARALVLNPELVVCDEPVSALDVSVHSQICNLLMDLQRDLGLTYLFISHNLSVVKHITKHMAVMYMGVVVESGLTERIFANPVHPYTKALLSSILDVRSDSQERILLHGEVSSPINASAACRFRSRCELSQDLGVVSPLCMEICKKHPHKLIQIEDDHFVACPIVG